jgi:hypothetical protein
MAWFYISKIDIESTIRINIKIPEMPLMYSSQLFRERDIFSESST